MTESKTEQVAPFYFYIDIGNYTGMSASSYEEFLACVKRIKTKSLNFHLKRGDFEKWVSDILNDEVLAKKIEKIKNQKLWGQALRNRLYHTVSERHKELVGKTR